jgi:hypothetical protein
MKMCLLVFFNCSFFAKKIDSLLAKSAKKYVLAQWVESRAKRTQFKKSHLVFPKILKNLNNPK